jgi:radical SAM protein with 4Fe4S-binding SPASM domain
MSGGEPLIRKDFAEIYSHAKSNGLLVTVFTNGTVITDSVLSLFEDLPPRAVEISLYGATAGTYEKITRVKGSFDQCVRGIERLIEIKANLKLKTMLMTHNRHEFYEMEKMAQDWGVTFRFDPAVFPCFNGDKTPMHLRVSAEEAIEKEFSDEDRMRQWRDYFERTKGNPASETLYECGAGQMSFHIDAYGTLKPCLMVSSPQVDLSGGGFLSAWEQVMPRIKEKEVARDFACHTCEKRPLCGFCPAFFELENGSENIRSEYLCAIGHSRFQAIESSGSGGGIVQYDV